MKLLLIVLCLVTLTGCAPAQPAETVPTAYGTVVRVEVRSEPESRRWARVYTSEEKIAAVLGYMRRAEGYSLHGCQEDLADYRQLIVTVTDSLGAQRVYCQYGVDYLLRPGDRLYLLCPDQGEKLQAILAENPSDSE